jgi:hypothetical protein
MPRLIQTGAVAQAVAAALLSTGALQAQAYRFPIALNDTGLTQCANFGHHGYMFSPHCEGTGQDALYGRDATANDNRDGHAGFSFVKISQDGRQLPRRALNWRCVLDTTTGLEWEVKTSDLGFFDYRNSYTNLNNGADDDAGTFVAGANQYDLCGASDWRLPSRGELESIMDFSSAGLSAMVDPAWFPNTQAGAHWSSTSARVMGGGKNYWWAVDFQNGFEDFRFGRYDHDAVRLVRGGQAGPAKRWKIVTGHEDEVVDRQTHRVWRRCAEGRTWTGATCTGQGTNFLQARDAMAHAIAEAERTGQAWRAPNIKELSSLVDTTNDEGLPDASAFPDLEDDHYHSGTFNAIGPIYNFQVRFGDGAVYVESYAGRLLLVRDATGQ